MTGVETWNAAGKPTLGFNDRTPRFLGWFDLAAGSATNGSFNVPALAGGTLWDVDTMAGGLRGEKVVCTQSGATLFYNATARVYAHRVFFGVY